MTVIVLFRVRTLCYLDLDASLSIVRPPAMLSPSTISAKYDSDKWHGKSTMYQRGIAAGISDGFARLLW